MDTQATQQEKVTVLGKAVELGSALVMSEEFGALTAAREAVDADNDASHLLDNYVATEQMLSELLEKGESGGEQTQLLSDTLDDLRGQIVDNGKLSQLASAQGQFQALMAQVNAVIGQFINPPSEEAAEEGCGSGGCAGCTGCS